ncbi:hypothetical protein EVA_10673 [gut metagenome]|uniref:Uncharacterized protein n=1 Tax=gut metagenome TaxID=749906 RepID=J9G1Y0_9ZZZZ
MRHLRTSRNNQIVDKAGYSCINLISNSSGCIDHWSKISIQY